MGVTELQAELDRREQADYPQTWRVINARRALHARERRATAKRGRRKHRNTRAAYRRQEKRLVAAIAGLKSAVALFDEIDLDHVGAGGSDLEQRARNALAFALDEGMPVDADE